MRTRQQLQGESRTRRGDVAGEYSITDPQHVRSFHSKQLTDFLGAGANGFLWSGIARELCVAAVQGELLYDEVKLYKPLRRLSLGSHRIPVGRLFHTKCNTFWLVSKLLSTALAAEEIHLALPSPHDICTFVGPHTAPLDLRPGEMLKFDPSPPSNHRILHLESSLAPPTRLKMAEWLGVWALLVEHVDFFGRAFISDVDVHPWTNHQWGPQHDQVSVQAAVLIVIVQY